MNELPEIYPSSEDTFLLVDTLEAESKRIEELGTGLICLEIGCGGGEVIAALHRLVGTRGILLATDVNIKAADYCRQLAKEQGGCGWDVILADLVDPFRMEVDLMVFNPPYVPTDAEEFAAAIACRDLSAAWAGGKNGREVIDRWIPTLSGSLRPGGLAYLVALEANKPKELIAVVQSYGLRADIVSKRVAGIETLYILRFQRGR